MAERRGRGLLAVWLRERIITELDRRVRESDGKLNRTAIVELSLSKHFRIPCPPAGKRGRPRKERAT